MQLQTGNFPTAHALKRVHFLLHSRYRGPVLASAFIVLSTLVALSLFIAVPVEPFAYYKDLGFNWEVIDWVVHTVRSPVDAFDALAWTPWNNAPLFYLNSYLGDVAGIIISWLVGNSWLSVKIVEALQMIVAASGAALLYSTWSRARSWATFFGLLYAAMPATVLAIRWNEDLGWIVALVPLVFAVSRLLLRCRGEAALPLVGLLCGVTGHVLAIQFLLFVSLPLYFAIVLTDCRCARVRGWSAYALLGAVGCFASGAFFTVPTFAGHRLFTDSAPRALTLETGAFLATFSETWLGLGTLVLQEWAASPIAQFNVSNGLAWLCVPVGILWLAAAASLARAAFHGKLGTEYAAWPVVLVCIVLAMGSTLPFGMGLWQTLFKIPLIDGIRTVDRFLTLVPLFIALWFVRGLEYNTRRFPVLTASGAWLLVFVVVSLGGFDAYEGSFTVDPSVGFHEPQLNNVRSSVAHIGGRTISLVGVNGGSFEDAPVYGRPQPIVEYADTDIAGRYLTDGIGAIGMFGRMGIRSVVTGPSWTYDEPTVPSTSNIYREIPSATPVFGSPEDIVVSRVNARTAVSTASILCVEGGPGAFDHAALLPPLASDAFAGPQAQCSANGYINFDPHDAWQSLGALDSWPGHVLGLASAPLQDADYAVFFNRTLLNIPWYRNAVDGQRSVFGDSGPVVFSGTRAIRIGIHHAWPAGATLSIRLDAHSDGKVELNNGAQHLEQDIGAGRGFRWYSFRLDGPVSADRAVQISLRTLDQFADQKPQSVSAVQQPWDGIAVDGVAVLPPAALSSYRPKRSTSFIAWSWGSDMSPESDKSNVLVLAPGSSVVPASFVSMRPVQIGDTPALLPDASVSAVQFRWNGAAGMYAVSATASLSQTGAAIGIGSSKNGVCCSAVVGAGSDPSNPLVTVASRLMLRRNDILTVQLMQPTFRPDLVQRITDVRLQPVADGLVAGVQSGEDKIDFTNAFDAVRAVSFDAARSEPDGLHGRSGQGQTIPIRGLRGARWVSVIVAASGVGSGTAALRCGSKSSMIAILDGSNTAALSGGGLRACRLELRWRNGDLAIRAVQVASHDESKRPLTRNLWIPAGTYRVFSEEPNGTMRGSREIAIPGCPDGATECRIARNDIYAVRLSPESSARVALLALVSDGRKTPRALDVRRTAALRWDVTTSATSDIAFTQMYDGNWSLLNTGHAFSGEPCDIVDTCFPDVPAGHYSLVHRWPPQLKLGLTVTIAFWLLAVVLLGSWPPKLLRRFLR